MSQPARHTARPGERFVFYKRQPCKQWGVNVANQHRRIERQIKGAIKKLKRGEIPFPPAPRQMSAAEEEPFIKEMRSYRRNLQAETKRLSADSSRAGHKKRLRL